MNQFVGIMAALLAGSNLYDENYLTAVVLFAAALLLGPV